MLDLFARRKLSPVDVLEAINRRIEDFDPLLKSFVVRNDGAMDDARASEARWTAGRPIGFLDGVPTSVKDLIDLRGFPTRVGSVLTSEEPATQDSPAVLGLKSQGAVITGKTATTEFGWKAPGDSPHSGVTRNPWNTSRVTGGSSSGAGAAAAAGFGPLHIGTDAGGSVRLPAAWCGLVGLKPTMGRIPNWPAGAFAHVASAGPMTRDVRDAALMFSAMARADVRDPFCLPDENRDWSADLEMGVSGLRVGILGPDNFDTVVELQDMAALEDAAAIFRSAGATVEPISRKLPDLRKMFDRQWSFSVERVVRMFDVKDHARLDPDMLAFSKDHDDASAIDFLESEVASAMFAATMAEIHRGFDLVICPTVPTPPPLIGVSLGSRGERQWTRWGCWTYLFNISREPALSMPMGLDTDGLPRSVQLVAGRYRDDLVLRAARVIEREIRLPLARLSVEE